MVYSRAQALFNWEKEKEGKEDKWDDEEVLDKPSQVKPASPEPLKKQPESCATEEEENFNPDDCTEEDLQDPELYAKYLAAIEKQCNKEQEAYYDKLDREYKDTLNEVNRIKKLRPIERLIMEANGEISDRALEYLAQQDELGR